MQEIDCLTKKVRSLWQEGVKKKEEKWKQKNN